MIQPSLFPQVSGVLKQGQGQCAGLLPDVCRKAGIQISSTNGTQGEPAATPLSVVRTRTGILPDVCRAKHQGNPQSEAANRRVHPTKNSVREDIYRLIAASAGLTSKEIGSLLNKQLNTFSGRLRELKNAGRIEPSGAEREGCAVLKAKGTV